jgi:hypothetical protein
VRSARVLALAQFVIAIASLLGIQGWPGLPGAMLALGERMGTSWSGLLVAQLGLVVPVLGVPCLLLGAVFPLTTRLLQHGEGGSATGRAYALNTLGTIAGSLVAGFVLLPGLGIQGSVQLAAALSCLAGIACLWLPGTGRPARGWFVAAAVALSAAGLSAAIAPRWDPMLMSLGTYRPFHARNLLESFRQSGGVGDPTRQVAAAQKVLFYREGLNASVLVSTDFGGAAAERGRQDRRGDRGHAHAGHAGAAAGRDGRHRRAHAHRGARIGCDRGGGTGGGSGAHRDRRTRADRHRGLALLP